MSEWAAVKVCTWPMRRAVRQGRQSGVRRRSARPVRISFSCLHEYQLPVPGGGAAGRARSLAQCAERRGGVGRWPGCWERCRGPHPRPLMVDARGARRSATAMRRPLDLCAGGRRCADFSWLAVVAGACADPELAAIRAKRMAQLQGAGGGGMPPGMIPGGGGMPDMEQMQQKKEQEAAAEEQRAQILKAILSPEARERLGNIGMVKPDKARKIQDMLIMQVPHPFVCGSSLLGQLSVAGRMGSQQSVCMYYIHMRTNATRRSAGSSEAWWTKTHWCKCWRKSTRNSKKRARYLVCVRARERKGKQASESEREMIAQCEEESKESFTRLLRILWMTMILSSGWINR